MKTISRSISQNPAAPVSIAVANINSALPFLVELAMHFPPSLLELWDRDSNTWFPERNWESLLAAKFLGNRILIESIVKSALSLQKAAAMDAKRRFFAN